LGFLGLLGALVLCGAVLFPRQAGLLLAGAFVDRGFHNRLMNGLPDGLHAGLCGSGSPMPDPTRAGPCVVVIAGKQVYVVDVGEGSPRKLALLGIAPALVDGILLTHFHSDHIGGLGELMLQRWAGGSHRDPVPVIGPQGVQSVVDGFNAAYALDKGYRIAHHGVDTVPPSGAGGLARPFALVPGSDKSLVVLRKDGLTITAFPVVHTPVFPAVGYRFDYGGRSIVVSGDTAPSKVLGENAHGVDVLFHEGLQTALVSLLHDAAVRENQAGLAKITADIPSYHTTPEAAARIAQDAGAHYLVFYHTIPPLQFSFLNAAFLGDAPHIFSGPITVARDGLFVTMPSGSSSVNVRELL
jgi:ribonuclease Z